MHSQDGDTDTIWNLRIEHAEKQIQVRIWTRHVGYRGWNRWIRYLLVVESNIGLPLSNVQLRPGYLVVSSMYGTEDLHTLGSQKPKRSQARTGRNRYIVDE